MDNETKHKGRPSLYSEEIAELICSLIAEGKSLVSVCRLPDMPRYSTVMRWCDEKPDFRDKYTRAREAQADYLAEEIITIADDSSEDEIFVESEDGTTAKRVENREFINRSKIRVDARKWYASKLAPKKYGDRIHQDVGIRAEGTLADLLADIDGATKSLVNNDSSND